MFESREIANMDPGIVDPRMAAEAVSATFLQCTLNVNRRFKTSQSSALQNRPAVGD
jgi:hypothetical protein